MIDFILTGDIHLREDTPKCRTDDFEITQENKLKHLSSLYHRHGCLTLNSGDTFEKARSSQYLEQWAIRHLPCMITVPGNHDLPYHSIKQYKSSSLSVLEASNIVQVLSNSVVYLSGNMVAVHGLYWKSDIESYIKNTEFDDRYFHVALIHIYAYDQKSFYKEDEVAVHADKLMERLSPFKLIVTGHNHHPFVKRKGDQLLVNPGSMSRQKSDENHRPRSYLWSKETNDVEIDYFPAPDGVMDYSTIEQKKEEDRRLNVFVEEVRKMHQEMKDQDEVDYEKNLVKFINKNNIDKEVEEIILECVQD